MQHQRLCLPRVSMSDLRFVGYWIDRLQGFTTVDSSVRFPSSLRALSDIHTSFNPKTLSGAGLLSLCSPANGNPIPSFDLLIRNKLVYLRWIWTSMDGLALLAVRHNRKYIHSFVIIICMRIEQTTIRADNAAYASDMAQWWSGEITVICLLPMCRL